MNITKEVIAAEDEPQNDAGLERQSVALQHDEFLTEADRADGLPFSLAGGILYHVGPVVRPVGDGWEVVAAGPTTSARLSAYEPEVIERYGVRAVIGKGGMDETVSKALADFGAVYSTGCGRGGLGSPDGCPYTRASDS